MYLWNKKTHTDLLAGRAVWFCLLLRYGETEQKAQEKIVETDKKELTKHILSAIMRYT